MQATKVKWKWEEGEIKRSLKSVLTPARHGTMCERKPRNKAGGRKQHFSETMALFLTFQEKNTEAMAVMVCLGTTACCLPSRVATSVSRLQCLQDPLLVTPRVSFTNSLLLFQNNPYSHSVFWIGGPVIVERSVEQLL
jgi:hypothetical protein